jgi:hypothetical protein
MQENMNDGEKAMNMGMNAHWTIDYRVTRVHGVRRADDNNYPEGNSSNSDKDSL